MLKIIIINKVNGSNKVYRGLWILDFVCFFFFNVCVWFIGLIFDFVFIYLMFYIKLLFYYFFFFGIIKLNKLFYLLKMYFFLERKVKK